VPTHATFPNITKSQPISLVKQQKIDGRYTCSGKTHCSQMTSCAEAKFYIRNCPNTKMVGQLYLMEYNITDGTVFIKKEVIQRM